MMWRGNESFVDLRRVLDPKSIAVIGASEQPGNLGGDTVRRLTKFAFPGSVWPINRRGGTVAGLAALPSVRDLAEPPELAILAIPGPALRAAIEECADAGIRHGIAYAGGLGEAGAEGVELQRQIVATCRERDFVLCGPNCVGVINATTPVTATFATALYETETLLPGHISMVSQSGGIGTGTFSIVQQAGFGFRYLVSSGNEAMVDFADYLHAFTEDPDTHVIGGYLEGIRNPDKFVRALDEAQRHGKPVVLIKTGRTAATARAAQAHTGALVGEDRVIEAVFDEFGVMRVHSVEELVDVMLTVVANRHKVTTGPGVGVVTFGGGNGVLAVDQCAQHGLTTPPPADRTIARLRELLVPVATAANPLDLTPTTAFRPEALAQLPAALDALAAEPDIQSLLFIAGSLASKANEISDVIGGFTERASKPVAVSWPSPPRAVPAMLAQRGIYSFSEPERAVRALARLVAHGARRTPPRDEAALSFAGFDWTRFAGAGTATRVIPEHLCHCIAAAAGLAVAAGELVDSEELAARATQRIGLPVVLKGISSSITHRAKAGLVIVDVRSESDARRSFVRLQERARELGVQLDGVYVQRMHSRVTELLVAAFRDPMFGVMVSCGAGGVLTELLDDVVTARAPVSVDAAADMIGRLRLAAHATDAHGRLPSAAPAAFIARFSELALTAPWERFVFELNPLLWSREQAIAVDGLLVIG